jgi:hypothetical protein
MPLVGFHETVIWETVIWETVIWETVIWETVMRMALRLSGFRV